MNRPSLSGSGGWSLRPLDRFRNLHHRRIAPSRPSKQPQTQKGSRPSGFGSATKPRGPVQSINIADECRNGNKPSGLNKRFAPGEQLCQSRPGHRSKHGEPFLADILAWLQLGWIGIQPTNRTSQFVKNQPGSCQIPDLGRGFQSCHGLPQSHAHQIETGHTKQPNLSREALIRFALQHPD